MTSPAPLVAVLMGSASDGETMQHCSAHRQPAVLAMREARRT
jgi:hypothetical protein